jgi:hypothetical protein
MNQGVWSLRTFPAAASVVLLKATLVPRRVCVQPTAYEVPIPLSSVCPTHGSSAQELEVMLSSPHLEACLRPGCVHLTLEALVQVREGWHAAVMQGAGYGSMRCCS